MKYNTGYYNKTLDQGTVESGAKFIVSCVQSGKASWRRLCKLSTGCEKTATDGNECMQWTEKVWRRVERGNEVVSSLPVGRVSLAPTYVEMTCLHAWHVAGETSPCLGSPPLTCI